MIAGGGMYGATDQLDHVIQHAAQLLRDTYGMDVTVRFNSDRESGGAWLRTHPVDRIGANAEIGITASVITERASRRAAALASDPSAGRPPLPPVGTITVCAFASARALNDPASADSTGRGYVTVCVDGTPAAMQWLEQHVHVPAIPAHETEGLTRFAYELRGRLNELHGRRVRVLSRHRRYGYVTEHRGQAIVEDGQLNVPRTDRRGSDTIDLDEVQSVEIMDRHRYRSFAAV
jgi:hypothetical protein